MAEESDEVRRNIHNLISTQVFAGAPLCGLIHHSDRGTQYASREYVSLLMSHGISVSMTENGDPKENAKAERINGTIKNEMLKGIELHSVTEAREA